MMIEWSLFARLGLFAAWYRGPFSHTAARMQGSAGLIDLDGKDEGKCERPNAQKLLPRQMGLGLVEPFHLLMRLYIDL